MTVSVHSPNICSKTSGFDFALLEILNGEPDGEQRVFDFVCDLSRDISPRRRAFRRHPLL